MQAIAETLFDIIYLVTVITIGTLMIRQCKGNLQYKLFGIMAVTLGLGDAFHLVPRAIALCTTGLEDYTVALGIGKLITSVTMTVFYIILMYVWKYTFPDFNIPAAVKAMVWISAIIRIAVCILPQNNWCTEDGNLKLSIIRNAVFAVTGIGVIILYAISGNANGYHMTRMVAAIIISFGCYLPVTLFSKTKPKVGLLMIPKTCAYMWIIAMGLQLLF